MKAIKKKQNLRLEERKIPSCFIALGGGWEANIVNVLLCGIYRLVLGAIKGLSMQEISRHLLKSKHIFLHQNARKPRIHLLLQLLLPIHVMSKVSNDYVVAIFLKVGCTLTT